VQCKITIKLISIDGDNRGEIIMEEKIPKHVIDIIQHYRECWEKANRCIHCGDCIAFALAFSENSELWLPPRGVPYSYGDTGEHSFVKFLSSTISSAYLPCNYGRALSKKRIDRFAKALLRLPLEARKSIRSVTFLAHAEFHEKDISKSSLSVPTANRAKLKKKILGL